MTYSLPLRISKKAIMILLLGLVSNAVTCQTKLSNQDYMLASAGMGIAVGIELFGKDHFLPSTPRFSTPNHLDVTLRNSLYWGSARQDHAKIWSDRLLYGASFSSLAWGSAIAKDRELAALVNLEVFALNSIITNLVKISTARERPYRHFGTRSSQGPVDYASFFSGHSSVAFSQAVTNAMILSKDYPEQAGLIWSSLLSVAGVTAYLRVASDMHYFSDIVIGAGVGSLIAWSLTQYELKRFDGNVDSGTNINVTFKIPLG